MALEDITARIIAKAQEEVRKILDEARRECDELKEKTESRLDARIVAALEKAKVEALSAEERIVAAAELDAKKRELSARQEVITGVLNRAIEKLAEAEKEMYLSFLQAKLRQVPFKGEAELIVSQKDLRLVESFLPALQTALDAAGSTLKLQLSPNTRELDGGFVLRQGRVEFNASLSSIKRSQEEELRSEASSLLFGDEDLS